jgi:hypothetical protein
MTLLEKTSKRTSSPPTDKIHPVKGFPNQVADLEKLASGMRTLIERIGAGENPKDDGLFGQALVRAGVAGTGHTPMPVEEYIQQQLLNTPNNQSFRTTARGLRER